MDPAERLLRVEGLTRTFGARLAVDRVSFDIGAGETYGLLGPNGAGKTTTISMIAGILAADSGTVTVDGRAVTTRAGDVKSDIGIVPQDIALYSDLTAEENLRFFGRLQGMGGGALEERIAETLGIVGLTERAKDRVDEYSGGMKRRANIAVGLLHRPKLLVLDEPTVGVDPQSRNQILDSVEQLGGSGMAVLYTTHYMEEAERLCDRVAIIDHGRLLACDTVAALVQAHGGKPVVEVELASAPPPGASLPGPVVDGCRRFVVDEPEMALAELRATGLAWRSLRVQRADLETVFLDLTGRSLRDA